jgi:ubiquitin carboxyl-terminal hydrolase L5
MSPSIEVSTNASTRGSFGQSDASHLLHPRSSPPLFVPHFAIIVGFQEQLRAVALTHLKHNDCLLLAAHSPDKHTAALSSSHSHSCSATTIKSIALTPSLETEGNLLNSISKMHSAPFLAVETAGSPIKVSNPGSHEVAKTDSCNDERSANWPKAALNTEESLQASPQPPKRGSVEPGQEPDAKRVKKSPASPQNCEAELLGQDTSDPVNLADSVTKDTWQGFCEIQSEPAYFSAILKDMGVRNIKIEELISLHPEYLVDDPIPSSSYGIIFLYQYRDQGSSDPPEDVSSHVWFANQLPAQNSCATLAMINILMNNDNVEIGEHLQQFKDFTKDFNPYQRGEAIASFDFVKKIHNSFAKKMDMLEADKHLSYKAKRSKRPLNDKKARRKSTDSAATNDSAESHDDDANHFIAFIPVGNEVWMLDGLNYQPVNMGSFDPKQGQDWVSIAVDSITAIAAGTEEGSYTAFMTGPATLPSLRKQACLALNHIRSTERRLDGVSPDWRSFTIDERLTPSSQMLGIEDQLSVHPTPDTLAATINSEETQDLLDRRIRVLQDLDRLSASIISEVQEEADNERIAVQARFDYASVIKLWAEMLAANGWLEQNIDRHIEGKGGKKGKK